MTTTPVEALDLQDMERLAAGEDGCLDRLMERHGLSLFRYLLRTLGDEHEAEDVAQATFVKVYQHRGRFDPRYRFQTWLYTIATHLARDQMRRRRRRPELPLEGSGDTPQAVRGADLSDPSRDPGEALAAREAGIQVRTAIQSLPEDLRIALVLAEYDELSHAEIGRILGCSSKAVEMRLYRARQALRTKLAPLRVEENEGSVFVRRTP